MRIFILIMIKKVLLRVLPICEGGKIFFVFFAEKFCEYKKLLYFCTVKNERYLTRYLKVIN